MQAMPVSPKRGKGSRTMQFPMGSDDILSQGPIMNVIVASEPSMKSACGSLAMTYHLTS